MIKEGDTDLGDLLAMRRVGVGDDSTGGGQDALRLGDHRDSLLITSTPGHRKQSVHQDGESQGRARAVGPTAVESLTARDSQM